MKWVFVIALLTSLLRGFGAVIYELTDDEYYKMPPTVFLDPYERCLRQPGAVYCSAYFVYVADQQLTVDYDEYYKMPPTVFLDPYERCLRQPGAVYCSAYFVYVADQHSPLLHQMQEYSKQTRTHFNHTRAFLGTCVSSNCKHLMNNSSNLELTLEACLNETVYEKYTLKVRLDDELFCILENGSNYNNEIVIDTVDVAVGIIAVAFVALNIVGSLFDNNYSEESKNGVVPQILLCFSLSRNWKLLKSSLNDIQDPRVERLKGIHGIRTISTTLVIVAHSLLPAIVLGENPQFVEEQYSIPIIHALLNGTLIMQTFYIMSSFLLLYNLQVWAEKESVTCKQLFVIYIKRWFRLTPPYAFVLALTATWIRHIGTGPLWQKVVLGESYDCRKDWWINLLFINNYVDGSYCMPQSWYLASDIQLYAVGLVVFLLGRDLEVRKKLLGGLFLLGLVVTALHTYFQDLDGNLLITPTTVMNSFVTDPTYNHVYRRGHTNLSGYVVGLSLGYLVYHLQKNGHDAGKYKKWRPIFWSLFPLGGVIIMSHKVFYDGPRLSIEYNVLGATLNKPLFAACIAALFLGFFVQFESVYRGVVEWGGWKPLSRVSYSAYLLHIAFIRTWTGLYTATFHVSYLRMTEAVNWMLVFTWLNAFIFWLTVEAPLRHVTTMLLEPSKSDAKKNL